MRTVQTSAGVSWSLWAYALKPSAPKKMSVTLDEALTPRAILDRISDDALARRPQQ